MTDGSGDDGSTSWKPWFYVAVAVLGLAGVGLIGYTLGASRQLDESAAAAAASGNGSAEESSNAAEGQGRQQFPARFDSLGVSRGAEDAPVVVREFADYQCPACRSFFSTARRIDEEYVESGQVRFVLFDLPVTSQHPNAMAAAQAARCAGDQGAYWPMHDALFENQREWSGLDDPLQAFRGYGRDIGIDADRLAACVRDGETRNAVERSREFARALGVSSTPTVVVGNTGVRGAVGWDRIRQMIEERLQQAGRGGPPEDGPESRPAPPSPSSTSGG